MSEKKQLRQRERKLYEQILEMQRGNNAERSLAFDLKGFLGNESIQDPLEKRLDFAEKRIAVFYQNGEQFLDGLQPPPGLFPHHELLAPQHSLSELTGSDLCPINVGDIVSFGRYEQSERPGAQDFAEDQFMISDLKWKVLNISEGVALLLSNKVISLGALDNQSSYRGWENCALRNDLNDPNSNYEFFTRAFTQEERLWMVDDPVVTTWMGPGFKNGAWQKIPHVEITKDYVFLPSLEEVLRYIPTAQSRICSATDSAVFCTSFQANENIDWFLRSGSGRGQSLIVTSQGFVKEYPSDAYERDYSIGIRPCIRVKLSFWQDKQDQTVRQYTQLIGQKIMLGNYVQNSEVKEPVAWTVLDVKGSFLLLCTDAIIESMCWDWDIDWIRWAWNSCEVYRYLNGDFLQDLFSETECFVVEASDFSVGRNRDENGLFLLSKEQLYQYAPLLFGSMKGYRTRYVERSTYDDFCWLRSDCSGNALCALAYSMKDNRLIIEEKGKEDKYGLRPAMWIDATILGELLPDVLNE